MARTPKPSPTQTEALNDLIDNRPGCHLLKMPTARALERHGWVTRRTVRQDPYVAVYFDVTPDGYAAVGRTAPVAAAVEQDEEQAAPAPASAAPGPLGELMAEMRERAEQLPDAIPPAESRAPEQPTAAAAQGARVPGQRGEWHPRAGGLSRASRRAAWAMTRRPLATVPPQVNDEQRARRQAAADRSPCATHNAATVEVYLSPLTGAAVHLLCGDCRTSHWSTSLPGTWVNAAAVDVDEVARLIRRQGVRLAGDWYDHRTDGTWSTMARRAPLERDDSQG